MGIANNRFNELWSREIFQVWFRDLLSTGKRNYHKNYIFLFNGRFGSRSMLCYVGPICIDEHNNSSHVCGFVSQESYLVPRAQAI